MGNIVHFDDGNKKLKKKYMVNLESKAVVFVYLMIRKLYL